MSDDVVLMTAVDIARRLSISKSWLLEEARHDRVPHVRFGRSVRFNPEAIDVWWRQRSRGPQVTR